MEPMTGVPLAVTAPLAGCTARESLEIAQSARDWGYRAAWASEVDGPDAFTLLGALAATTDLDLGVGVVPVQTRTVFTLGMTAVSLAQLSGGRFVLGIGASSEVLVSRFGGQPFDRPLRYVREAALALRPILRGERSTFEGRYVRIGGYKTPIPPPAPVPLFFGSLNPRSLRLAGELADGLCVNQIAPHHVPAMLAEVRDGARGAGREIGDFPVMARLFCAVTDDAPAVRAAAAVKDRDAMAAAFTDRMARDLFVIGDAGAVVARLHDYVDAGITIPVVAPLAPGASAAAAILRAVGARW